MMVDAARFRNSVVRAVFPAFRRRHFSPQTPGSVVAVPRFGESEHLPLRGGQTDSNDDERYSRQVYTLGARAHRLVRSATVFLDGPAESGLLYECAKNLALSGVGRIILLSPDDSESSTDAADVESCYFNAELDDLGKAYLRAARAELGHAHNNASPEIILVEFIKRLNPSVKVLTCRRSELLDHVSAEQGRRILVAVDRPQSTQITLNELGREQGLAFVAFETAGVYGRVFCDFGKSFEVFDADGETPLVVPLDRIEPNDEHSDDALVVHVMEGEKHDVSKGDVIRFQLNMGETLPVDLEVMHVENPRRFTVRCHTKAANDLLETINERGTSFSRMKVPKNIDFVPLGGALKQISDDDASLFTPCDLDKSFDSVRRSALMSSFESIEIFAKKHSRLPGRGDTKEFRKLAKGRNLNDSVEEKLWKSIVKSVCKTCAGKLTPIQAIIGAIGAQEVLKAASGLYNPIQQFLLYDCDELLETCPKVRGEDEVPARSGQSYILGQALCDSLAKQGIFVVGSGAIGCELLKNLSAMGVGRGKGKIILTDMDTIEQSNLSRQLLFRDADIGKFKSTAAQDAILRFDPSLQIEAHTSKVGQDEQGPFHDNFWAKKVDVVLNALDNMEARLFIDGQCVANRKALVDAGTLGPKGNVQVVVPFLSESYGSSADPPEPAIALCTLKNFPYAISHTIQWSKDLFDGYFERRPKQANDLASEFSSQALEDFLSKLEIDLGEDEARKAANELATDWWMHRLVKDDSITVIRATALDWAVKTAHELFHKAVADLLAQHPVDSRDEDGEPFWSGSRRVPKALVFLKADPEDSQQAAINTNLIEFVRSAARLRLETFYGPDRSAVQTGFTTEEAAKALSKDWPEQLSDQDATSRDTLANFSCIKNILSTPLEVVEFEKDDDTNDHVAFVTAASNLRAICYGIAPVDAMETRRVAGRIVPAMISTTAFVSALSCIELLKLVQKASLRSHRNSFVNLALPFFAFTQPLPAEPAEGLRGKTYTLWDRIVVKEKESDAARGGISLSKFFRRLIRKAGDDVEGIVVSSVSYGPYMVYTNFLHEDDESVVQKPVVELIKEAIQLGDDEDFAGRDERQGLVDHVAQEVGALSSRKAIELTVIVEDQESGEEFELPSVRLERHIKGATVCR
jgi:ubiquitin-activating enzyme E1